MAFAGWLFVTLLRALLPASVLELIFISLAYQRFLFVPGAAQQHSCLVALGHLRLISTVQVDSNTELIMR